MFFAEGARYQFCAEPLLFDLVIDDCHHGHTCLGASRIATPSCCESGASGISCLQEESDEDNRILNDVADALLRGEYGPRCCLGVGCAQCRLQAVHAGTGGCFWSLSDGHALRVRALRVRRLRSALRDRNLLSSWQVTFGSDVHFGTEMNILGPQAFSRPWPFVCGRRRASVLGCVVKLAFALGSSLRTLYHCRMILPRSWNTHIHTYRNTHGWFWWILLRFFSGKFILFWWILLRF